MKNEALYNKTVDILTQAYFNDTLVHGDPCGCAVGNIVASNLGITVLEKGYLWSNGDTNPAWGDACIYGRIIKGNYRGKARRQIDCTGYTIYEIAMIERAFESALKGNSEDDWMFNGLMAVVDVLDQIHENTDPVLTTSTKQKFQHA